MPHAGSPAGPGRPRLEGRDAAKHGEQVDETLGTADERVKRTGNLSSRSQPSPQVGNEPLPGEPTRSGEPPQRG